MIARTVRSTPQRTCVGCRQTTDQHEFIRLVRSSNGNVVVDWDKHANGRGAYLCRRISCWTAALKSTKLSGALRTTLNDTNREQLQQIGESLKSKEDSCT